MTNQDKNKLFSEWVNDYSDQMYSWAFYKTYDKELAEDLVQETFMSAFKAIESFQEGSKAKTWLFRILNNKIIDYYRKQSKAPAQKQIEDTSIGATDNLFEDDGHWKTPTDDFAYDQEEHLLDNPLFNQVLGKCIGKLPFKWKYAIEAKYQKDISAKEICKELNISTSNYWQIVHRAKLQLKTCLEQNWTNE